MGIKEKLGNYRQIWLLAAFVLVMAAGSGWYMAGASEQTLAADTGIPVYLNGPFLEDGQWRGSAEAYEQIGWAELAEGYTYVPLRAVFEACEVEVSWNGQEKLIEAELGDGQRLRMTVNSRLAYIGQTQVELDAAPFAREGAVFVPLRFVGETLGCGVDWRNGGEGPGFGGNAAEGVKGRVVYLTRNMTAGVERGGWMWRIKRAGGSAMEYITKGAVWRLDCGSGLVTMTREGKTEELGRLDLSPLADLSPESYHWSSFYAQETPQGNWQVRARATVSGAVTGSREFCAWLAPELGKSYNTSFYSLTTDDRMEALWFGGEICLPGAGEALFIDDATGELVQRLEGSILRWADEDWALFGHGTEWVLIDRGTEERRDLSGELLSEANKARLEEQVRRQAPGFDEMYRSFFWEAMGNELTLDLHAYLQFLRAEDGALRFRLVAINMPPDAYAEIEIKIEL